MSLHNESEETIKVKNARRAAEHGNREPLQELRIQRARERGVILPWESPVSTEGIPVVDGEGEP